MSEPVLIALAGAAGVIIGAIVQTIGHIIQTKHDGDAKSSDLLLEAQRQLADQLADNQLLWQHNRKLVDWIWSRKGPPPPDPPPTLFKHERKD